jgi:hypothetical protein
MSPKEPHFCALPGRGYRFELVECTSFSKGAVDASRSTGRIPTVANFLRAKQNYPRKFPHGPGLPVAENRVLRVIAVGRQPRAMPTSAPGGQSPLPTRLMVVMRSERSVKPAERATSPCEELEVLISPRPLRNIPYSSKIFPFL